MQKLIKISTDRKNALYDITSEVVKAVKESGIRNGIVSDGNLAFQHGKIFFSVNLMVPERREKF